MNLAIKIEMDPRKPNVSAGNFVKSVTTSLMWILKLATMTRGEAASLSDFSCPGIGFFGSATDCNVYFVCTGIGKRGSPMKCGEGLGWNQERLACEWRTNLPKGTCDGMSDGEEKVDYDKRETPKEKFTTKRHSWPSSSRLPATMTTSRFETLTEEQSKQLKEKLVAHLAAAVENTKILLSLLFIFFL